MYTQLAKSKKNKSQSVANSLAQKKSNNIKKQALGFVDNRTNTIVQRKIQKMVNKEGVVQRLIDTRWNNNLAVNNIWRTNAFASRVRWAAQASPRKQR